MTFKARKGIEVGAGKFLVNEQGDVSARIVNEIVNVKAFGAKGDSVTDDSNAISLAAEHCVLNGGILFFPRGDYRHPTYTIPDTIACLYETGELIQSNRATFKFGTRQPLTSIKKGQAYFDTTTNALMVYDGTTWIQFARKNGSETINGNLTVTGDLIVQGDNVILNVAQLEVEDNIITLNRGVTGAPTLDSGIEVNRGTAPKAKVVFDEAEDVWKLDNGNGVLSRISHGGAVNVKDFGAKGDGVTDDTAAIQRAIDYCKASGVKRVSVGQGVYLINGTLSVSGLTGWDLEIYGVGKGVDGRGTSLLKNNAGYILNADLSGPEGSWRGLTVKNLAFKGNNVSSGIYFNFVQQATIENVLFSQLAVGITLTGDSHFNKLSRCMFFCPTGVLVPGEGDVGYKIGQSNNCTVENSFFTMCSNPLTLKDAEAWTIRESDFEGENGAIVLSSKNNVRDVRIERNKNNEPWVVVNGDLNSISVAIESAGGNTANPALVIKGNLNDVNVKGSGVNIIDETTSGKNNIISVRHWKRLLDGQIVPSTVNKSNAVRDSFGRIENLLKNSNYLESLNWTKTPNTVLTQGFEFLSVKDATQLVKTTSAESSLKQRISGSFKAGDIVYFSASAKGIAGGYWEIGINDVFWDLTNFQGESRAVYAFIVKADSAYVDFIIRNQGNQVGAATQVAELWANTSLTDVLKTDYEKESIPRTTSLPTASASQRGRIVRIEGATGVADSVYVCVKKADDSYDWAQLF